MEPVQQQQLLCKRRICTDDSHLPYLASLMPWSQQATDLSWDCWVQDSEGCYNCRMWTFACSVSEAHSPGGSPLCPYTGKSAGKLCNMYDKSRVSVANIWVQ